MARKPQHKPVGVAASLLIVAILCAVAWAWLRPKGAHAVPIPAEPGWRPAQLSAQWKGIVLHHSATEGGGASRFDTYHRDVRGWSGGLGYHFVIGNGTDTPDGQVEVGPRWASQERGAHTKTPDGWYNEHTIGICLVGNFDQTHPTPAQLASLQKLLRFLCHECNISPSQITGHGHVTGKTDCPGKHLDVAAIVAGLQ